MATLTRACVYCAVHAFHAGLGRFYVRRGKAASRRMLPVHGAAFLDTTNSIHGSIFRGRDEATYTIQASCLKAAKDSNNAPGSPKAIRAHGSIRGAEPSLIAVKWLGC